MLAYLDTSVTTIASLTDAFPIDFMLDCLFVLIHLDKR